MKVNEQPEGLPGVRVAVKVTFETPTGKVEPEAGPAVWAIVEPAQLSLDVAVKVTIAPRSAARLAGKMCSAQFAAGD